MWAKSWPNLEMEIEEKIIGGVPLRLPKNRPRSLREALRNVAERYPEKEAAVYEDLRLTYREICEKFDRISASLISLGFHKGDRIGLLFANTIEFVYSYFAVCQMGAVCVPLNYRLSSEEMEYQLMNTGAKGLILEEEYWPTVAPIRERLPSLEKLFLVGKGGGKGIHPFEELQENEAVFPEPDLGEEDLASIMFTSGTTGRPKGVMLSHRNLICNGLNASYGAMMMRHDSKQLIIAPLFHAAALHAQLVPNFLLGATAVLLKKFATNASLEIISREKINYLVAVPTMYWFMIKEPGLKKYDLSQVQTMISGGAPCPPELIIEFCKKFPHAKFMNGGGMTECSSGAWGLPPEYNLERPASIGFAFPCVDVRTVDRNGNEAGVNEPGELWYRGPAVGMGYWNNEQAWAETFTDGWLHSGDIGRVDEDGFIWLLDRAKDMIIRAGENVYCVEVENALYQNAKVAEVAVVGVPDEIFGEKVKAFVALREGAKATAEELRAFCSKKLADYMIPEFIEFVRALPRNPSGKVEKKKLKEASR